MRKLLLLAALCAACGDTTIVDPMERQPKFKPFAANPQYEDGRAMRQPPEGTVPREWAERLYDVRRWTPMPRGGHFAPAEAPDLLARDISEFFAGRLGDR